MGLNKITGSKVYIDTNIFIYALEYSELYTDKVSAVFSRIHETKSIAVTSQLTLAECLVKPYQVNDISSVEKYEQTISSSTFLNVIDVSKSVLLSAAQNKAHSKNKLPDAIHLATAIESGCTIFITNDNRISAPDNIEVLMLSQI